MVLNDHWYKHAIIYSLDVETFQDSDGDGVGDFAGLSRRLDYLAGLGVTCLWLLPFYPSPNRDNGYDITDYYGVDPRLGTLGDFVAFMHEASGRGLRVIIDLVVNHTSDQHPWFQSARSDPRSPYRDFYVWSEERPRNHKHGVIFPGVQETNWTYDERAGAYYLHRFYENQPDLNFANPAVRAEILKVVGFWLELGVSGFRLDAAPFLIEVPGDDPGEFRERYAYLDEMRQFLSLRRGDAVFLAEANVSLKDIPKYFGDGHRMHMLFNFLMNQDIFLALAEGQAEPLVHCLKRMPKLPTQAQWGNFLRNHDELSLDKLSERQRQQVFAAFGPAPEMQIYGRGIRRRLAPMLEGDRRRLELAHSLVLTLPGTPVLRYGDEIGMGDDLSLPERESVRTPMQWRDAPNGGFSSGPRERLARPVIADGPFGYQQVNVALQQGDQGSLLNWLERAISVRKQCPEFGWGDCQIVPSGSPAVLALRYEWDGGVVLTLHNLSGELQAVALDLSDEERSQIGELMSDGQRRAGAGERIELGPYGYRWLRIAQR